MTLSFCRLLVTRGTHFDINCPRITLMFSLSLVILFLFFNRILTLHGEEVEETDISGFQSDKQTFYCGNVNSELIIQVTSSSARLVSTRKKSLLRYNSFIDHDQ